MIKSMVWIAVIRTMVQSLLALGLATAVGTQIVDGLQSIGIPFNETVIVETVAVFLLGLVVLVVNWLGPKFAWINKVMSLGLSRTSPAYVPNDADAVVSTAHANNTDSVKVIVDTPPPGPN